MLLLCGLEGDNWLWPQDCFITFGRSKEGCSEESVCSSSHHIAWVWTDSSSMIKGSISSTWNQTGTVTGRLSAKHPVSYLPISVPHCMFGSALFPEGDFMLLIAFYSMCLFLWYWGINSALRTKNSGTSVMCLSPLPFSEFSWEAGFQKCYLMKTISVL